MNFFIDKWGILMSYQLLWPCNILYPEFRSENKSPSLFAVSLNTSPDLHFIKY